jgi:hypothetical protein
VAGCIRDAAGDFPLLHVHYSWRLATVQPATLPCAAARPLLTPQLHRIALANSSDELYSVTGNPITTHRTNSVKVMGRAHSWRCDDQ